MSTLIGVIVLSAFKIICNNKVDLAKNTLNIENTNVIDVSLYKEEIVQREDKTKLDDTEIIEDSVTEITDEKVVNSMQKENKDISKQYYLPTKEKINNYEEIQKGQAENPVYTKNENTEEINNENTKEIKEENIEKPTEENPKKESTIDLSKAKMILPEWLRKEIEENGNRKQ